MTSTNGDRLSRVEAILEGLAQRQDRFQVQLEETAAIARSNARSIQAWEALIEQNKVEAEEERSALAVRLTDLEQASRENIQQHFDFRERFDRVLSQIEDLRRRMAG